MRLSVSALFLGFAFVGTACTEEYPNPPATRDGTEGIQQDTGASLPPPSTTTTPPSDKTPSDDAGVDAAKPVGPTSGVEPTKTIGELNTAEKKQLCDWQAGVSGGYGKTTKCEGGLSTSNPKTQTACVQKMNLPSCQASVADVEACFKVDAQDPCAFAILSAPECESIRACME